MPPASPPRGRAREVGSDAQETVGRDKRGAEVAVAGGRATRDTVGGPGDDGICHLVVVQHSPTARRTPHDVDAGRVACLDVDAARELGTCPRDTVGLSHAVQAQRRR